MPFRKYLTFKKSTDGNQDFSVGTKSTYSEVFIKGQKIGLQTSICYEGVFSLRAPKKPDMIINITNDAWFGNTTGPFQHLIANRLRVSEIGLPAVRVANSGISVFFDSDGNIIKRLNLNVKGYIQHEINLINNETIFSKFGQILTLIMVFIVAILSIIFDWFLKKSGKKDLLV